MGQSAETMAKVNGISRQAQDAFALRSHRLAHAAAEDGRLVAEIAPFFGSSLGDRLIGDLFD